MLQDLQAKPGQQGRRRRSRETRTLSSFTGCRDGSRLLKLVCWCFGHPMSKGLRTCLKIGENLEPKWLQRAEGLV